MKDWESKLESTKLQKEISGNKNKSKLELENLRHEHIIEELKFMAKHKITSFVRGNNDKVAKDEQEVKT